jgi:hypothetical protein
MTPCICKKFRGKVPPRFKNPNCPVHGNDAARDKDLAFLARKEKAHAIPKKWKRTIGVAMSHKEVAELDARIAALAIRDIEDCGCTTVNRSSIIRYALSVLDWDSVPSFDRVGVEGKLVGGKSKSIDALRSRNKRKSE